MEQRLQEISSPFFIVGSPRSGTTLLERMLNRHSQIFIPPETEFFHALRYALNDKERAKESPKAFLDFAAAYSKWQALQLIGITDADLRGMANRSSNYRDFLILLLGKLAERAGKSNCILIGEKSPLHLHHTGLIRQMFPTARFIATVRDGRAVVVSRMKHPHWNRNLVTFSREWVKDSRMIRKLRLEIDSTYWLEVRYEDLVTRPEHELRKVCAYLGIHFSKDMLDHHSSTGDHFNDYYKQPWMSKSTSAIDASRIDAWSAELNEPELALIEFIAKQELLNFNYKLFLDKSALPKQLWAKEQLHDLAYRIARRLRRSLGLS